MLVIEPDDVYASTIQGVLRRDGWDVSTTEDPARALDLLERARFRAILVDVSLEVPSSVPAPAAAGVSAVAAVAAAAGGDRAPANGAVASTSAAGRTRTLLRALREERPDLDTPLVALSEPDAPEPQVRDVLECADGDLPKPFSPRRLRATLRTVTRRGRAARLSGMLPPEVRVGDLTVASGRLEASVGDRRVELSPREFSLLHFMLAHPGTVFTREELSHHAWGWAHTEDSRAVDNTVRRLRQKIESAPRQPRYIVTERGAGYRLAVP